MNYDDETLMAYADGELDEAQRAAVAAAIERDPALARRVESHRALRVRVAGAFANLADQPVPERLVTAVRGADVVPFPARTTRSVPPRWRAREWTAMAASLVLGVLVTWKLLTPGESPISAGHGALLARGALATALDQQLASTQSATDPVQIGVTFHGADGQYCRSFVLRKAGTAGLACRAGGEWQIAITAPVAAPSAAPGGEVRQAASPPPEILQAIGARISGEALDAAGEADALRGGWDSPR